MKSTQSMSHQLKALEPHFDGTPIHRNVQDMETRVRSIRSEGDGIIIGAIGHREAYTREILAIMSSWLNRSEEEIKRLRRERKGVTTEFKKVL